MIKHLAAQMDGNRRWAIKNGLIPQLGHYHGIKAAQKAIDFCLEQKIPYLSLYTFSIENFRRTEQEKSYLFDLLINQAEKHLDEYIDKGVKIKFIGNQSLAPDNVAQMCKRVEEKTKNLNNLQVNLLFCYGAQQEIVEATKNIIKKIKNGELKEEEINEKIFAENLWTNGTPEPELIIRSGGAQRISNFLLFQSAYSEYFFVDTLWPDMQKENFNQILEQFKARKRNFGA